MAEPAAAPVVVTPKSAASSHVIRWNALFGAIGTAILVAPEFISQLVAVFTSSETRAVLAFLPQKYQAAVDSIIRGLGVLVMLIAALNGAYRKWSTVAPITGSAADKLPEASAFMSTPTSNTERSKG